MYNVTVKGHSLYEFIGQGLSTPNNALAILSAEAISNSSPFEGMRIEVWELQDGLGGLNHNSLVGYALNGVWNSTRAR